MNILGRSIQEVIKNKFENITRLRSYLEAVAKLCTQLEVPIT